MGVDKTVLTAADGGPSGQAALFIGAAKDVTVKDMTIELTGGTGDASPIKATFSGDAGNHDVSENLTLENLTLVGNNLGNGLNLHGVRNVTVNNVTVENYAKCGIALAYATDVEISNVTFTKAEGCWADIGMMYKDSADYAVPVTGVVLGEGIDFAMYVVYAENAEYTLDYSEYADVFGLTQTADGWALTRTIAARIENADGSYVNYSTVQGAINAAKANDVVTVMAGTFDEALVINKDITLVGAENGGTIIAGPKDYSSISVVKASESGNNSDLYAIVLVTGGANVTLENITVQGKIDQFLATYGSKGTVVGLAVCNASLTAENVNVYDITIAESDNANYFGVQTGIAVLASAVTPDTYTVSFTGGEVKGFEKGGFVIRSGIKLFTLKDATVLGCGETALIAQNAVQVACDSVIEGNTLGDVEYTGADSAAAILTVDMLANGKTLNGYSFALDGDNSALEEALAASNTFSNSEVNFSVI